MLYNNVDIIGKCIDDIIILNVNRSRRQAKNAMFVHAE